MVKELAAQLALRGAPEVRMSLEVPTPLVTGLRRSVILLPQHRFGGLSDVQQRMAICHELVHVKRRDLWLGCIPALAERLFFFHPLAHVAAREYEFWRESACDSAVLDALHVSPHQYGRLLLELGVARPPAALAAAVAPWSFTHLKRRIIMLGQSTAPSTFSRVVTGGAIAAALAAIVPLQLAARDAARAAVASEPAPPAQDANRNERVQFVLFANGTETTMSGDTGDLERARTFRRAQEQMMLWFRHQGHEYVVRDPAVLRQLQSTWTPVNALGNAQGTLGDQQGTLGTKQGELGTRQGELGTEHGRLGTRQGIIGNRQAALAAREASAKTAAERESAARERRAIESEMQALEREMQGLDARMRDLDKPMQELGAQMDVLGSQMDALGKRMEEAVRKAELETGAMMERTISSGLAERVR